MNFIESQRQEIYNMINKFKKIRTDNNLTQKKFANLLGVTIATISRYENDIITPPESIILLMMSSVEALKLANKKAKMKGLL